MLKLHSTFTFPIVVVLLAAIPNATSNAQTVNIQTTGFALTFGGNQGPGGAIFDSPDLDGGNLDPTETDLLNAIQFNLDGNAPPASGGNNVFVSDGGTGYYGDFLVDDVGATVPISNMMLSSVGGGGYEFGFDLFSSSGGASSPILRLEFDAVNVLLNPGVLLISAQANVVHQNLPFGLGFGMGQQVEFAYTATNPGISGTATDAQLFVAEGTINISGTQIPIPEPSSALLIFAALAGLVMVGRTR